MTLLTASERAILERIRDNRGAAEIDTEWAIEKGWAVRSSSSVKLTAAGTSMLESDEAGTPPPPKQSR